MSKSNENSELSNTLYSEFPFPNDPRVIITSMAFANKHLAHLHPSMLLFLGCGTGEEVIGVSQIFKGAASIVAVEPCKESYDLAYKRITHGCAGPIEIYNETIEEFATRRRCLEGQFDFIWCSGVLHHTQNPAANLACIRQFITTNGRFLLGMYHHARWQIKVAPDDPNYTPAQIQDNLNHPIEITLNWREFLSLTKECGFIMESVIQKWKLPVPRSFVTQKVYDLLWYMRSIQMMTVILKPAVGEN